MLCCLCLFYLALFNRKSSFSSLASVIAFDTPSYSTLHCFHFVVGRVAGVPLTNLSMMVMI